MVSPSLTLWVSESHSVVSASLGPHGLYSPWNSPGQNTGVGSLSLLQGIFPTQGLNQGLAHCRRILHQLNHKGSQRILQWAAWPFLPQVFPTQKSNWVSCIAGRFVTNWAIREAHSKYLMNIYWVNESMKNYQKVSIFFLMQCKWSQTDEKYWLPLYNLAAWESYLAWNSFLEPS